MYPRECILLSCCYQNDGNEEVTRLPHNDRAETRKGMKVDEHTFRPNINLKIFWQLSLCGNAHKGNHMTLYSLLIKTTYLAERLDGLSIHIFHLRIRRRVPTRISMKTYQRQSSATTDSADRSPSGCRAPHRVAPHSTSFLKHSKTLVDRFIDTKLNLLAPKKYEKELARMLHIYQSVLQFEKRAFSKV